MECDKTLEDQLLEALGHDDQPQARQIARQLHERGFDLATLESALQQCPQLEQALYAVLQEVMPLARRAAKRRAIRAAEERDWGDWQEGKKPTT